MTRLALRPFTSLALLAVLSAPAAAQDLLYELLANDAQPGLFLGGDVMVHGDRAILGAHAENVANSPGAAYVFDLLTGQQVVKLTPSDGVAGDSFGYQVALTDSHAVVLSFGNLSAYVFDRNTGQELYQFTPTDGNWVGRDADAHGTRAVVGAGNAAYVFDLNTGQQLFKLSPPVGNQYFGESVAIWGDRAIVGALNGTDKNGVKTGVAYVFDLNTGNLLHKLEPSDGEKWDYFGSSVSLWGDRAAVGSHAVTRAKAYIFDLTTGEELFRLKTPDGSLAGERVSLYGDRAIIKWENGVYFFDARTGLPLFDVPMTYDSWRCVAIGPEVAVVGHARDSAEGMKDAGAGFAYRVPASVGTSYCGPAVANSSGAPGVIEAIGRDVVADDQLVLLARQLPENQFGYFLASLTQGFVANPGGSQGNLCLGGQIGRLSSQIRYTGELGGFTVRVDLTAIPVTPPHAVQPGETWYFQAWFRDKNPGPTSNFTDGVGVAFL